MLVWELVGADIFETEEYEVWLNGLFERKESRMIASLYHLKPDTDYTLTLKRKGTVFAETSFHTRREFVTLDVRSFGAKGDGQTDDTGAIQTAILCCPPDGRVYIPEGHYRIRNLFLKSNLVLEIGKGALLEAFRERERFPVLPGVIQSYDEADEYNLGSWEGNPLDSMCSIFTGIYLENVEICGEGTIDGGGDFETWWVSGTDKNRVAPYRPRMIFLNHCSNVVIQGIRVQNSPAWNLHPYFSEKIRIYDCFIVSPAKSHNTDGIDPESCRDVEIAGVHFHVGDDCIALKSGKIYMGRKWKRPSEQIRIRQCWMEEGHGAVTIGSEIAGGVRQISVSQCRFTRTDRGLRIKTRRGRGTDSIVDEVCFDGIQMDAVKSPFVVNCFYYCDPDGRTEYVGTQEALPVDERTPEIRSLCFRNIDCRDAEYAGMSIYGLPEKKIGRIELENIQIRYAESAGEGISAMMLACPPTSKRGIFARNVRQMVIHQVTLDGAGKDFELEEINEIITDEAVEKNID
ncbi:MAG: glycoside hydrolase family 28 protein [Lachnospiraceae bacterium]|nr:glycoside hydrolase family 28 protein [Lachnospiraceae bacterium]